MTDEQSIPRVEMTVAKWAAERTVNRDGEQAEPSRLAVAGRRQPREPSRLSDVTPEDLEGFRKRYAAMETQTDIAADTRFSAAVVRHARRRSRLSDVTPEDLAIFKKRYAALETIGEIAAGTGFSSGIVGRALKNAGVKLRRGRPPLTRPGAEKSPGRTGPVKGRERRQRSRSGLFPSPRVEAQQLAAAGLRPRQIDAVQGVLAEIAFGGRCRVTMPPGSGKTRVGAEVSRLVAEHGRVLVVVPSLPLLTQIAAAYVQHLGDQAGVLGAVCSDDEATGDAIVRTESDLDTGTDSEPDSEEDADDLEMLAEQDLSALADLNVGSSTQPCDIAAWTGVEGRLTVFSTYASLPKIAEAHRVQSAPPWDLIVVDEAHRAAGLMDSVWGTVNRDEEIPSQRRLYMTASPRVLDTGRGGDRGELVEVASMDNEQVFGREVYKLPFRQAIEEKILAEYQFLVCTMTRSQLEQLGATGSWTGLVTTPGGCPVPWNLLVAQIALLKAAAEHDARTAITFHHKVAGARLFAETLSYAAGLLPVNDRPNRLIAQALDGKIPREQRRRVLDSLHEPGDGLAVVSNARVLTEGVDVPELDAVVFVDPRKSSTDIIQAAGRALRRGRRPNKVAKIIIPVLLPEPNADQTGTAEAPGPQVALDGPWSALLVRVVCALADQDERLREWLDSQRARPRRHSDPPQLPPWMELIGDVEPGFVDALAVRVLERTTSSWLVGYGAAQLFHAEHGHLRVHGEYVNDDGLQLGEWIMRQRQVRNAGGLAPDRVALLDKLGMIWDVWEADWQEGHAAARAFHTERGHLNVPRDHVTPDGYRLGQWIRRQRMHRNKGSLAASRIAALDRLGIDWEPAQTAWQRHFAAAVAYFRAHGNLKVHYHYVDPVSGLTLGRWIRGLRQRKNGLTDDQITALDSIGMIWGVSEHDKARRIAAVEEFYAEHGHLDVPRAHIATNGFKFGEWLMWRRHYRRKGELSDDEIAYLDRYGMVWNPLVDAWNQGLAAARRYRSEHGHLHVPTGYTDDSGFALADWLRDQRDRRSGRRATAEEIRALDELDMIWNVNEFERQQRLAACHAFYAAHRHLDVPADYVTLSGVKLGRWLEGQRVRYTQGLLSEDEIADLNRFGMVWNKRVRTWNRWMEAAHRYHAEHGNLDVHYTYVTPDGRKLGNWINHVRQQQRKGVLTTKQKADLDALGINWNPGRGGRNRGRPQQAQPVSVPVNQQQAVPAAAPAKPVPALHFMSGPTGQMHTTDYEGEQWSGI